MPDSRSAPATAAVSPAIMPVIMPVITIVDDDAMVVEALRGMLEDQGWSVEDYPTGEAFLAAYRPGRAGCLLLDAQLPGIGGVALLQRLQTLGQPVPAIMVTGSADIATAVEAMKAGAMDLIEKPVSAPALVAAVARLLEQVQDSSKLGTEREAAAERVASLTKRQREIMELVVAGQPSKIIAADLGISQRTVENHRMVIMKKTGSRSLPALARLALAASGTSAPARDADPERDARPAQMEAVLATPDLAGALESDQFRRFFDQIPLALVVSTLRPDETNEHEHIIYANPAFEQLTGQTPGEIEGQAWTVLRGQGEGALGNRALGVAITDSTDGAGTFHIERPGLSAVLVDVYANVIMDDDGTPIFRLAALVDVSAHDAAQLQELEQTIREKDTLLNEIQHRVKNNLQMITALIRAEARHARGRIDTAPFDRLAGRINAIQIIYRLLSGAGQGDEIDLGVYLSEIVSSVMHAHAMEGIRLDLKVDAFPVSVNVALPTGMVVNELLTNALKHAFVGRDGGTITLHSLSEEGGCRVVIADDGVGLPDGVEWPRRGRLGEMIVRSLRQNAKADLKVESSPGAGTRVTIGFARAAAAPATASAAG